MGEVLFPRVVPVVTKPFYVKPSFADNDWETIIKACQKGRVPETWKVGDQKIMTIGGTDYPIDIIGKNHDVYADGSGTAPLTFQLHNIYKTKYAMDTDTYNGDGWNGCNMRRTYLPKVLAAMPSEVQAGIREVSKWTSEGNDSSTIEKTSDTLFLLSEIEIFGKITKSFAGEGSQYAYYVGVEEAIKTHVGSTEAQYWFERSPHNGSLKWYCCVDIWGGPATQGAEDVHGAAPAFCF